MIQEKMIVVQNDDPSNVTQNQPPMPNDIHFIDMICDGKNATIPSILKKRQLKLVELL